MRKKVRFSFWFLLSIWLASNFKLAGLFMPCAAAGEFSDDFSNGLDASKWLIAKRQWGGSNANGGVIPQNVSISGDGVLSLIGNGDLYAGPLRGINKNGSLRPDGKRTGACVVTKDYFASGRYEVRMKVLPHFGACSALWTFFYHETYPGGPSGPCQVVNHEIDIEQPGRPGGANSEFSFNMALCNTWEGENTGEYTTNYVDFGCPQNDGQWHTYRFDWHTNPKKVDFYVDGTLKNTCTTNVPTIAGRFWVGVWFPNGWAGAPDFDRDAMLVDWVRITPFNESGDQFIPEVSSNNGWAAANEYPKAEITRGTSSPEDEAMPVPKSGATGKSEPAPKATQNPAP